VVAPPAIRAAEPPAGRIVAARLVSERTAVTPGSDAWLALHLRIREGWHVYWKNPGDSGTPPRLTWRLPDGVTADDLVWPAPSRFVAEPLASFGYEREVYLPVRMVVAPAAAGPVRVAATAKWLACKVDCIPESAELSLTLPLGGHADDGPAADGIRAALASVPRAEPGWGASIAAEDARTVTLRVSTPPRFAPGRYSYLFFPDLAGVIEPAAAQPVTRDGGGVTLVLTKAATRAAPVDALPGVFVARPEAGAPGGVAAIQLAAARAVEGGGLWAALGLAFAGGLLLNLMPCVFPVIAIKVVGFVEEARAGGRSGAQGLAFAAGVVVSFWVLAGLLLALRAAGAEIGWGFQLQSPPFVLALAFLFLVLALAFLGGVELGGRASTFAGGVRLPRGLPGSFLGGALTTAVATPCTAPFMGTALGWALTAPPVTARVVFTALALGTALPYVVLSASPGLVRALPRPGPWMESLKQALAFPLLATVVWLLWVFGLQAGADAQALALAGLLLAGFGVWLAGRVTPAAPAWRRRTAALAAVVAIAVGFGVALPRGERAAAPASAARASGGLAWEPYSAERLAALRAAGRPVYVDFTAAWCLTCQLNERVAFGSAAVREAFERHGVVPMRADWTNQDAEITRALAAFGRSGVPLNVLYGDEPSEQPIVQPTLLTPAVVLRAIEELLG
jgi:thiol:disulfide interchange protein DsbD